MELTQDFWIGALLGLFVGFLICYLTRPMHTMRDTGPHKTGETPPPPGN
jgi:hypothetical protein